MKDLVSIIVPSYNHKKYLSDLLVSIHEQSYKNIETIIVDDGSVDGSPEMLISLQAKFKFKLIIQSNEGLCASINRGLDVIKGAYIIIIASDDFMPIERVEQQVEILSRSPYDAISGGMTIISVNIDLKEYQKPKKTGEIFFSDLLKENLIFAPTVMFKAQAFAKYGRYNKDWAIEDYPMWLKILAKKGRIAIFDLNWAFYRKDLMVNTIKHYWYFNGLLQSLLIYDSNPLVKKAINKFKFRYFIKCALNDEDHLYSKIKKFSLDHPDYSVCYSDRSIIIFLYFLPKPFKNAIKILLGGILKINFIKVFQK